MLMDRFWKKPPNMVYMLTALMVLLHYLIPLRMLVEYPLNLIGILFLVGGLVTAIRAKNAFVREKLPLSPGSEPVKILTTDLYGVSRNPMYLGFVVMLIGVWIPLGSVIPVIGPLALFLILNSYYIPFEEQMMNESFPVEWDTYTNRVRRWL